MTPTLNASRWTNLLTCALALLGGLASAAIAATSDTPEARAYIEQYGIDFSFDREQEIIALYTKILSQTRHDNADIGKDCKKRHCGRC